jgi:hypothetical protein
MVSPFDLSDDEVADAPFIETAPANEEPLGVYAGPCPECRGSGVVFRYDLDEHERAWLRHLLGFDDDSDPPAFPDVDLLPDV